MLVKPDPFQAEGTLDKRTFHFANEMEEYEDFVNYEQEKTNRNISRKFYMPERTRFLCMPNLTKCGWMHCSGCGNPMYTCHDVVFSAFCVHECIKYCNDSDNLVCDTAVKKVFLDTYNRCLAFMVFRTRNKTVMDKWVFPPLCVQDNSYSYVLFWYEWIVQGLWRFNGDGVIEGNDDGNDDDGESVTSDE